MRDREAGAGTSGYLAWVTRAEPPADKPGDSLAQRLMGIPGDRDRLSVKIVRNVECGAHTSIITSLHHDAVMQWPGQAMRDMNVRRPSPAHPQVDDPIGLSVQTHVSHILAKLGAHSRSEIIRQALEHADGTGTAG